MFFGIGFVLAVIVAFVSPYLYVDVAGDRTLLTAVTTVAAWLIFAGGGYLLDRRRRAAAAKHEQAH